MGRTAIGFGRRRLIAGIATATAVGLAGCSGGDGGGGDGDSGDGGDGEGDSGDGGGGDGGGDGDASGDGGATPTPTAEAGVTVPDLDPAGDVVGSEARSRVDEFLSDVDNYEGEIMDATGRDEVVVAVGAEGNGGNFAFEHPAIVVSSGTTVSWRWTGLGGQHNVVSRDPSDLDFDSGSSKISGDPYEHSFGSAGVGLYVCVPHVSLGMKGAVVVVSG
jgi:halocyanin-like protein